jgi:hypothetical protein
MAKEPVTQIAHEVTKEREECLYMHAKRLMKVSRQMKGADGAKAFGIAMVLVAEKRVLPFVWDDAEVARLCSGKRNVVTQSDVVLLRPKIRRMFVELKDGRWLADPKTFTSMDPYERNEEPE